MMRRTAFRLARFEGLKSVDLKSRLFWDTAQSQFVTVYFVLYGQKFYQEMMLVDSAGDY